MAVEIIKRKPLPIGIDLGSSRVKMIQLRSSGDDIELIGAGAADIASAEGKTLQQRLDLYEQGIKGILQSNPFKTRQCILSLPTVDTFVQHVKIPILPPRETLNAVKAELQGKLPYPLDGSVIRHIIAGEVQGEENPRREVIVIAASKQTLKGYLNMLYRAKLDVVGVNIEPCAIVECFSRLFRRASDSARTILFIDVGACTTQVALSHGSNIVFARNLMTGGHSLDRAIAEGLGVSEQQSREIRHGLQEKDESDAAQDEMYRLLDASIDSLGEELTQCLRYYESVFRNEAIERAIFIGGQAHDKRLCQALAKRLNLPAQIGDPLVQIKRLNGAGLGVGLDQRRPQPDWAVAVGLSFGFDKPSREML